MESITNQCPIAVISKHRNAGRVREIVSLLRTRSIMRIATEHPETSATYLCKSSSVKVFRLSALHSFPRRSYCISTINRKVSSLVHENEV